MPKAEITDPRGYRFAPEGHTTFIYVKGTVVEGRCAEKAIAAGKAKKVGDKRAATAEGLAPDQVTKEGAAAPWAPETKG